jgi:peptidoglycan/LPS O-acetylase OafA/YrhL
VGPSVSRLRGSSSPGSGRLAQLDLLRAIAILLVLGRHINRYDYPVFTRFFFIAWQRLGWIGVDLFFVLSGFLIAGLLFREQMNHGRIRFGRFFARRGLKIYPAFYVMIGAAVANLWITWQPMNKRALLDELFFLQSYGPSLCGYTWSLAVEEHFYLLLPLVLILMLKRSPNDPDPFRRLPMIFACFAVGILALRILTVVFGERIGLYHHAGNLAFQTHSRLDSLLFGVCLSYLYHYRKATLDAFFTKWVFPLAVAGVLCVAWPVVTTQSSAFTLTMGFTLLYLGFGSLLVLTLRSPIVEVAKNTRPFQFLAYIGTHSYSIYLWHGLVALWIPALLSRLLGFPAPFLVECSVYLTASVLLGILAANVIEIPVLKVRDTLFPSRADKLIGSPVKTYTATT